MDDGKPMGAKAKWWSRPRPGGTAYPAPQDSSPAPGDAAASAETRSGAPVPHHRPDDPHHPADAPYPPSGPPAVMIPPPMSAQSPSAPLEPAVAGPSEPLAGPPRDQGRPQPLHEPDSYSTPPYGRPGPWAPAPPVQRPSPTPAHGTSTPQGTEPPAPYSAQVPSADPQPASPPQPGSVQFHYDPWSTPSLAPLTQPGEPVKGRGKGRRTGALLTGAVLLALVAGGIGGGIGAYVERNGGITQIELDQAPPDDGDRAPSSVAGIAARALPSVVTLHVSGGGEQGTGTGFVLDRQGHILTNNHVVDPAGASGAISVTFSGGETASATLVGKDSGYDLAVVKVSGVSGLTPLPLGNSDNVRVGDPVVAIGAPFDLQNTVTSGIISAKERPITAGGEKGDGSDVSYVDALQTDAPINPGNSGGPLVDTQARVIGINSAIRAADTGGGEGSQSGSIGLGFAIPINQGKRVAEELINTGKATHPVIGVSLDMKYTGDGARVGDKGKDDSPSVTPGGPSAKAGVKPGDVITKVDGQRVHSGEELIVKIRSHRPGDTLELTLTRAGKERSLTLTLGSAGGT
ncbi:S1C family serine protease [Streptomyces albipurpureus]|uniref:Trypsin-like peptidase domain-containing protein n=1 Tax=Streptomyces albipurpureus TaxID=2897419 RepID=A0ABT0ULU2_9ACTN|nr:trypsin-like peptidase domain-containing protein [Streptomyces sp. CWNU-1]MCM2389075.1 trypsin-like peptidase domain-containing protein [Streptomyces sp. CWNU-1]